MTACSNHPGTPAGLALAGLLGDIESLLRALQGVEDGWCRANGITRNQWRELRAIQARNKGEPVAGASPALVEARLVEACPAGYRLSPQGLELLWALDRLRFDWADEIGRGLAAADLREQGAALRRITRRIAA